MLRRKKSKSLLPILQHLFFLQLPQHIQVGSGPGRIGSTDTRIRIRILKKYLFGSGTLAADLATKARFYQNHIITHSF
jgi:hypothetical protein